MLYIKIRKLIIEYDNNGNIEKIIYPDGRTEQYWNDGLDRVTKIIHADNSFKKIEYDALGHVKKETDEEGNVTELYHNVWGEETYRVIKNSSGDVQSTWRRNYSIFGEVTKEESGDGRKVDYTYNSRGLITERTDSKGIKTSFAYDKCGRIKTETRSSDGTTQTRSYEYDKAGFIRKCADGNIVSVMNGADYVANAYGLVTTVNTTVDGKTLQAGFEYDEGLRLRGVSYPDSSITAFIYNGIGQLKTIGNDSTSYANDGTYDNAGKLTKLQGGNGLLLTQKWNNPSESDFDVSKPKNMLKSYGWGISGKANNTLTWNNRGNITAQTKNGISYTYSYDKKNQLTEEKKGNSNLNSWTYDATGNRKTEVKGNSTAKTVTCYTKSDLIKSDGTWYYNYDNNGNMTYKGKNATTKSNSSLFEGWTFNATAGEVWKYEYDLCNRLVRVSHSDAGFNNLTQVTEYKYDFRDLMVCRTIGTGNSAVSEYFAYDTDGKLIYTEKGTEKHDYIYANSKIWCEIVTSGTTKNTYYHHTDHLGTTVCITNTSGTVVWECEEDAFGNEKDKTNSSFIPNFTGKLLDLNTGLYYFNARWYAPDIGRFITEDPARDGRNWFVYCRNNPCKYTDSNGCWVNVAIGAAIGFISSSAAEIGGRITSGQSFGDAVKNTFTDKTSLAIIGTSTLIGAATSGVSGLAVNATTKGITTAASLGLKSGVQAVGEIAVKTVAINTVAGAVDAGAKDIVTHTIKGESESLGELTATIGKGALSAVLFSSFAEGAIAAGTTTSGQTGNILTGTMKEFNINNPIWAGVTGVMGESVIPTAVDLSKEANRINNSREQN